MYRQKKRQKNKTGILILIAAIVVLCIGTFMGWKYASFRLQMSHRNIDTDQLLSVSPQTRSSVSLSQSAIVQSSPSRPPKHDYTLPTISNGLAPVISRIPTSEPVVFLGIDDGSNKQPFELQMMQDNNIKASLFLANRFIRDNPTFFLPFIQEGSLIEDHTLDHKLLPNLSYDEQKQEICGMADLEQREFGRRPILFRPPGGSYNADTQRAAADCGMKAVVLWIAKANGGSMQYQIGHQLRAGDIVLMHFRPEFQKDMQAFIDAENSAGLHTELLEDWLGA